MGTLERALAAANGAVRMIRPWTVQGRRFCTLRGVAAEWGRWARGG